MNTEQAERHLRYLIVGLLHVGRLRRGDPLPSIRSLAESVGADHRTIANAYRTLSAEGLVEIRPGSGVFLARDLAADRVRSETDGWIAELLVDGWVRRTPRSEVGELVARYASERVRCACIESNEDHMSALAAELEADFSLDTLRVMVDPAAEADMIAPAALADAGFVVSTAFHAQAARAAALRAGKACVIVRVNALYTAEVARRLKRREVTAVVADPRYIARAERYLAVTPHRNGVRFVLADSPEADAFTGAAAEGGNVLLTRAARRRLGLPEYHLVPSPPSYLSLETAREIYAALVASRGSPAPA